MEDHCKDTCDAPMGGTQLPEPEVKLWAFDYAVLTEPNFRGVAVVSAVDPSEAEKLFKAETQHNGVQNKLCILGIEEIKPKERALQFETYIRVFE